MRKDTNSPKDMKIAGIKTVTNAPSPAQGSVKITGPGRWDNNGSAVAGGVG